MENGVLFEKTEERSISQSGTVKEVDTTLFFNPRGRAFNDNPYPHYDRLREEDPIHRSPLGVWFVGRYEHVRAILKDRRFSVQDIPGQLRKKNEILKKMYENSDEPAPVLDDLIKNSEHWFAFLEPPNHTRLRGLFSKAFQKHTVEGIRDYVRESAYDLLKTQAKRGEMDLMQDFACLLPQRVIAKMMGIPESDYPQLVIWTEILARIFDPLVSIEEYKELNKYSTEYMDYLRSLIQDRRRNPEDDLISALIDARDASGQLTDEELISSIIVVFGAGEETVVNLIGNGSLALMRNRDKLEQLRNSPEIITTAVDELLRYDAPLQMTSRTALEDVEIFGKNIKKGDQLYIALGSANRDPRRFEKPDQMILTREKNHHMSFADGLHICVGAQLARLEGEEAFKALLDMFPDIELVSDEIDWRDHTVLRGIRSLPVKFSPHS